MIRIGPSGNSVSFYNSGLKHTFQAAEWLKTQGLNAYEYSFGRGVAMSDATADKIKSEFIKNDVEISAHAPYYINFANESDEMIEKSFGYVLQSLVAINKMGGQRVVFHPAACGKSERDEAVSRTKINIKRLMELLDENVSFEYKLCCETMGKMNQIGRVEEVVEFCKIHEKLYPCFDFGHINSYSLGGIKSKDDYKKIIDYTLNNLGEEKTKNIHIHFSKIEYGKGGEVRHLDFTDTVYGPEYQPLAEIIDEYNLTPFIICESKDRMSDDAIIMKNMHKNI